MKILLTGVTGYIAQRLLPVLLQNGHQVVCCVRDKGRFNIDKFGSENVSVVEANFLKKETLDTIPNDIDLAFYLIHSMTAPIGDFVQMEEICANNFKEKIQETNAKQVIYLSGISHEDDLSKHLFSRKNVEEILADATFALTTLRAGIIMGSGSASFEIIRDLVEKMPIMIAPRLLETECQPIAIRNVVDILSGVIGNTETYNKTYDIGGPNILTYKEMLLQFAKVRGLGKRFIFTIPIDITKISSYWLYFITSTSFSLSSSLVSSMKVPVICRPNNLIEMLGIKLIDYETSIMLAFQKIEQNQVLSSWKDAQSTGIFQKGISQYVEVPVNGCFIDIRKKQVTNLPLVMNRIWAIGGNTGWYYGNWLWELRGFIDQLFNGVGMRRGRRSDTEISPGDALDFWRVLLADKEGKRLLLYAEMKLPGEAWLEFRIDEKGILTQTATYRPLGVLGRAYWYSVLPFHGFIFRGMIRNITKT